MFFVYIYCILCTYIYCIYMYIYICVQPSQVVTKPLVTAPPPASTSGATCGSKESSTPAVSMIEGDVCGNRNCSANCKILTNDG